MQVRYLAILMPTDHRQLAVLYRRRAGCADEWDFGATTPNTRNLARGTSLSSAQALSLEPDLHLVDRVDLLVERALCAQTCAFQ